MNSQSRSGENPKFVTSLVFQAIDERQLEYLISAKFFFFTFVWQTRPGKARALGKDLLESARLIKRSIGLEIQLEA